MARIKKEVFLEGLGQEIKEEIALVKRRPGILDLIRRRGEIRHQRAVYLRQHIEKAGMTMSPSHVSRMLLVLCVIVNLAITFFVFNRFYARISGNVFFIVLLLIFLWVFVFMVVLFVMWLLFYLTLDVAIFKRKQKLEEVLPDFLQLASSNIRAGMTIDRALWYAVRPRFGILANEIEEVAKRTVAGEPLDTALRHFVKKYDSKTLDRSMNLLIEGLRAGGEIGDLLNKIAGNIQETNLMKKELAANVTTYIIFITFATLIAAPFLFGMAYQLIIVIQEVFSRVDISPGTSAGMPLTITKGTIATGDFQIFAIVSLIITSLFSAMIISAIKKGNLTAGLRYIPTFMIGSVLLFLLVVKLFGMFTGGFF
jgi:Flp pilus assembly protein TadB